MMSQSFLNVWSAITIRHLMCSFYFNKLVENLLFVTDFNLIQ